MKITKYKQNKSIQQPKNPLDATNHRRLMDRLPVRYVRKPTWTSYLLVEHYIETCNVEVKKKIANYLFYVMLAFLVMSYSVK